MPGLTAPMEHLSMQLQRFDLLLHREILRLREILNGILSKHTKQTLKKLQQDTERDYFMSGEEAKEYGIIDSVVVYRDKGDKTKKVS